MRAWCHPNDWGWVMGKMPDHLKDAFTWRTSALCPEGHIFVDASSGLRSYALPSAAPLTLRVPPDVDQLASGEERHTRNIKPP